MRRAYAQRYDAPTPTGTWDGVSVVVPWGGLASYDTESPGSPDPFAHTLDDGYGGTVEFDEAGLYVITFHAEVSLGFAWDGDPPVGHWGVGAVITKPVPGGGPGDNT